MVSELSSHRQHVGADIDRRLSGLLRASEGAGVGRDLPVRSLIFDCIMAGAFFCFGSIFLPIFSPKADLADFVFVALVNLPLMLRRRLPRVSFGLVQAAALVQIWWPSPIGLHDAGMLYSFYSLVGLTNRRTGLLGWVVIGICALSGALNDWWNFVDEQIMRNQDPGLFTRLATTGGMLVLAFTAWASGERLRSARLGQVALAERADQLERERSQQSQIAAAAERARIAREMHDVIAHALSVMIAQADGGAYVIDQDPAEAKKSLQRVSATGRDSLTQMRGLLGLLRDSTGQEDLQSGPQPGLAQLGHLFDEATQTGLQVHFTQEGSPDDVADMVGLTLYRLVQECLTNARKHGGDEVDVRLAITPSGVDLDVTNAAASDGKVLQTGAPGHGLQGMRERVAAVGGRLTAGPTQDGFAVHAWVPHRPDTVASSD